MERYLRNISSKDRSCSSKSLDKPNNKGDPSSRLENDSMAGSELQTTSNVASLEDFRSDNKMKLLDKSDL